MIEWIASQMVRVHLGKRLRPIFDDLPKLHVEFSKDLISPYDVIIEKRDQDIGIVLSNQIADPGLKLFRIVKARLPSMLYWRLQAGPDVKSIIVHLSDGDHWGDAGFFFSTNREDRTPLPDLYFFEKQGFTALREIIHQNDVPWEDRSDDFVWRGGINGNGYKNVFSHLAEHPATCQRLRMAWKCKGTDIDFGFVEPKKGYFSGSLDAAGFTRDRIEATEWLSKKFAIDIDGFSNSWDNFYHRMLMGCCVLKVGSDYGFRQWYYGEISPWEHYVPVNADLSDLSEKIAWVRDNDERAKEIGQAARDFSQSMTFESETRRAGRLIDENWQRYL